jgi:hypothetical protein
MQPKIFSDCNRILLQHDRGGPMPPQSGGGETSMTDNKRRRVHMADPLIAHLVRARAAAAGAGFPRTNLLIEQALCTVMAEYRGDDCHDESEIEPRVA